MTYNILRNGRYKCKRGLGRRKYMLSNQKKILFVDLQVNEKAVRNNCSISINSELIVYDNS